MEKRLIYYFLMTIYRENWKTQVKIKNNKCLKRSLVWDKLQKQSFLLVYQKKFRNEKWKNILYTIATKLIKYLRLEVGRKAKCLVEHN